MTDKAFLIEDGVLLRYTGSDENVIIPAGIEAVGDHAFADNNCITSVSLPEGLTEIGYCAFRGCAWLRDIVLPGTLRLIGAEAFRECESLEEISVPAGVREVPRSCFSGCLSLRSAGLPDSIVRIGANAFSGCSSLTKIGMKKGLTEIEGFAFENCQALTSVDLPNGLEYIGRNAFSGCGRLTDIYVPETVSEIGQSAFYRSAVIDDSPEEFIVMGCGILVACKSKIEDVSMPEGVKTIGELAFAYNQRMRSVSLPEVVTKICESAFERCTALEKVDLPESLRTLGDRAFEDCSALSEIKLPEGIELMGSGVFDRTPLTERGGELTIDSCIISGEGASGKLTFPQNIHVIAGSAFTGNSEITSVSLDNIRSVGKDAFRWCRELETAYVPKSVQIIGQNAFSGCEKLHAYIERAPRKMGEFAFDAGQILTFNDCENGSKFTVRLLNPLTYGSPEHALMGFAAEPGESRFMQLYYPEYLIPAAVCYAVRGGIYADYLNENITAAVRFAVDLRDSAFLGEILALGFLSERQTAECAAYAIEQNALEQQIMIMRCKHESFGSADDSAIDSRFDW